MLEALGPYVPSLLKGAWTTVSIGVACIAVMVVTAMTLTLANHSLARWVRNLAFFVTEFMRGNSAIVLLFWVFFAVPLLPGGFYPTGTFSAIVVLGIAGGAYASEGVRGAFLTIPQGQRDACEALGIGFWRREFRIMLPQALPMIISTLSTMSVEVFKWTAAVSLVAVQDVVHWVQAIRSQTGYTLELYTGLVLGFYVMSKVILLAYLGIGRLIVPKGMRGHQAPRVSARLDDVGLALFVPQGRSGR